MGAIESKGSPVCALVSRAELAARRDAQLGEDLVQVVLDGAPADEQPAADLGVRQALAGEPGDLGLLGGELAVGKRAARPRGLAGGAELARGALGERADAHAGEEVVRGAEVLARVQAAALAPQPLAVVQMGARQIGGG